MLKQCDQACHLHVYAYHYSLSSTTLSQWHAAGSHKAMAFTKNAHHYSPSIREGMKGGSVRELNPSLAAPSPINSVMNLNCLMFSPVTVSVSGSLFKGIMHVCHKLKEGSSIPECVACLNAKILMSQTIHICLSFHNFSAKKCVCVFCLFVLVECFFPHS